MTIRFVKEELAKIKVAYAAVIVDNAGTETSSRKLAEDCGASFQPQASGGGNRFLIWTPENLGYAKGNNLGVDFLKNLYPDIDFWLFSNDDVIIQGDEVIPCLINGLTAHPECRAAGPRVTTSAGQEQSPHDHEISIWRQMGWRLFPWLRKLKISGLKCRKRSSVSVETGKSRITYWVSGAFMLVEAKAFQLVGGFDPATFLYFEEILLAERLKKKHFRMLFVPEVQVIHLDGSSSKGDCRISRYQLESMCYFYRRYKHVWPSTLLLWKAVQAITSGKK